MTTEAPAKTTSADGLTFRGVLKEVKISQNSDTREYLPFGRVTFETEKGLTKINISEILRHPMGDIELQAFRVLASAKPGGMWELVVFTEATMYNGKPYVNLTATEAFPLS
jgi:hypothetical protein